MACENKERVLHGYFDGELDLVRSVEFEDHLKACPECAGELKDQQTMRQALRVANLFERAPKSLEARIIAVLPREPGRKIAVIRPRTTWSWLSVPVLATIVFAIVIGASVMRSIDSQRQTLAAENSLAREIVSSHIRSLQPGHLFDVQSTDQHTVKPWFDGRIDFAPPVVDLANHGFPLVGGRLDYLDHRSVAALVYQRQKHLINVFVWPEDLALSKLPNAESIQGYNLICWKHDRMDFCVASDLSGPDLHEFVRLLER